MYAIVRERAKEEKCRGNIMSLIFNRKMPIPKEVKENFPMNEELKRKKELRDKEIEHIFTGESDKFLLIVGPCSADREKPVLDYVYRLSSLQEKIKDKIVIIPRVYTNKPRTMCSGYMGMIHQPDPLKEEDILEGIISVRKLHIKVVEESGLTAADEMLYPEDYRYISDIVSYIAIGARSVENQQHRLTASGVDIPVGIKNPTSGNLEVMLNSISAAQHAHTFLYRGWEVVSNGNPLAHAILRGKIGPNGENIPNYYYEDLNKLFKEYSKRGLKNMSVIVDTNHSNSGKEPLEQIRICKEVMGFREYSSEIKNMVKGIMIESYLEDGNQSITGCIYGKSVTDPCLGWDKTEKLIYEIAEHL